MAKKKKNKAKNAAKAIAKGQRKADKEAKKALKEDGEEDIEAILAEIEKEEAKKVAVTETASSAPTPRCNFCMVQSPSNPSEYIVFGGEFFNGDKTWFYNHLFVFNIERQEWRQITSPNTPPPRSSHQMVAVAAGSPSGSVYLFGGEFASLSQSQFYHYRDLWQLDLKDRSWARIDEHGGPSARSGHRMVLWKRKLVVFGGFHDNLRSCEYFNDVVCFDLDTYKWKKPAIPTNVPGPPPRSGCQMAAHGDSVIVYGGYSKVRPSDDDDDEAGKGQKKKKGGKDKGGGSGSKNGGKEKKKDMQEQGVEHTDLWVLDMQQARWTKCKMPGFNPSPRVGFSMVAQSAKRRCFFFGGVHDPAKDEYLNDSVFYDDLFELNLETFRWKQLNLRTKKKNKKKQKQLQGQIQSAGADKRDGSGDGEDDAVGRKEDWGGAADQRVGENHQSPETAREDISFAESDDDDENKDNSGFVDSEGATTTGSLVDAVSKGVEGVSLFPSSSNGDGSVSGEEQPEPLRPMARINCALSISGNSLLLFGGVVEKRDREITLSDMWKIDVAKLDKWECLAEMEPEAQQWFGEDSESEDGEESEQDDYDDEKSSAGSDEGSDDDDEEAAHGEEVQDRGEADDGKSPGGGGEKSRKNKKGAGSSGAGGRKAREEMRRKLLEGDEETPRPFETLRDFFERTGQHWAVVAYEQTNKTGKALRRDGFELAERRFNEMRESLRGLEEEQEREKEAAQRAADEAAAERAKAKAKSRR